MLTETEKRGATSVEPSAEAVQDFLDDFWSKKRKADRFWAECTPGFFNNEGNVSGTNGFFSDIYGGGIRKFFANFQAWRDSGDMVGMKFEFERDMADS
jgi:cyclohexanone monooxygenase